MKKILIVSYYFNQINTVASVRVRGLAIYLHKFGWEPVVLTVKTKEKSEKNFNIIETEYDDILEHWKKKLGLKVDNTFKEQLNLVTHKNKKTLIDIILDIWGEIFTYPDPHYGWFKYGLHMGNQILCQKHFDAVLSSSGPSTSHFIASELSRSFKIPWVADFRDLWTQNHYYNNSFVRRFFERRLEVKTLSPACALTTVSQPLADKLKTLHKDKNVYTITNGYDPKYKNPGERLLDKFTIVYTGVLYQGKRDPEPLFQAISELIKSGKVCSSDVKIQFYGTDDEWLINDIKKYKLENVIKVCGSISREESILEQRKAQVLLLLTWNHPAEKGVYTGKLFDYLAARRPILALGIPGSVIEELLKNTKAGTYVSCVEELKNAILSYYQEYKLTGKITYKGNLTEIDKYSHREMARKFAGVLDSISKS